MEAIVNNNWLREDFEPMDLLRGAATGAIAGLVASYAMNKVHSALHPPDPKPPSGTSPRIKEKKQAEDPATVKTAGAVSQRVFHHQLNKREKAIADPVVHYAYGASMGAIYGAAAEITPLVTAARGMAYSTAIWLFGDEIAVPALGLSKPPTEYPAKTHGEALLAHLAYGVVLEATRRFTRVFFS
jgi:uncharacterized membrane protein YagU involved in acid resistance